MLNSLQLKRLLKVSLRFIFRIATSLVDTIWNLLGIFLCFFIIYNFDENPDVNDILTLPEFGLVGFFMSYNSMKRFDILVESMEFKFARREAARQLSLLSAVLCLLAFIISFIYSRGYLPIYPGKEKLLIVLNVAAACSAIALNVSSHIRYVRDKHLAEND